MSYSALALDQSMTSTALAHLVEGQKSPTGWMFPMPVWGDDAGRYATDLRLYLLDQCWDLQVTHLFYENVFFNHLDHHETRSQSMASIGLMLVIEMVAEECRRRGQEVEDIYIDNQQWTESFWGSSKAPSGYTKAQKRNWRKEQSIKQCHLRGWDCQWEGKDNHNVADAKGVLNFGLTCIDPRWAANAVPLFNRAQLHRENEERELR